MDKYLLSELKRLGYIIESVKSNETGSNHHVYEITLKDGEEIILKTQKFRETELKFNESNKDTLFGGTLSLEREAYLLGLLKKNNIKVPKVLHVNSTSTIPYIIVEKCLGESFTSWAKKEGIFLTNFLDSMESFGKSLSKIHEIEFKSFGNIMDKGVIEPKDITNFSYRYKEINDRILKRCEIKRCFKKNELYRISTFFNNKLKSYQDYLSLIKSTPRFVITDLFGSNFFVDEKGHPTGFFDVESSQAAPLEFELYAMRFFIFNFYDQETFNLAEKHFLKGYKKNLSEDSSQVIDFFSSCRLLELIQSYWGIKDGLRDSWAEKLKKILFEYMKTNIINYMSIGNIWRERDKQSRASIKEL